MNHTILTGQDLNERPERHDPNDPTRVLISNLHIFGKSIDSGFCLLRILPVRRSNDNCTVVLNINSHTKFFNHPPNNRPTRSYNRTNFVGRNFERKHTRRIFAEIISRSSDSCFHIVENLQPSNSSLLESLFHDLESNSLYLDVHLQCSDTFSCTCNLEVHVTRVVFSTLNVGKDSVVVDVVLVGN